MKVKEILADSATVAGCCVGAGFLSGKEAQLYYGNTACVLIFVAVFCILTLLVRNFALKKGCRDVTALCKACYPKMGTALSALACGCYFVCIVAIIAGAESCLSTLLLPNFEPFFGIVIGFCGVLVVKNGLRTLKMLNLISLAVAGVYIVWLAFAVKGGNFAPQHTPPHAPIIYAVFSATMALGIITKVAHTNKKSNIAGTIITAVCLVALSLGVLYLCDFNLPLPLLCRTENTALNALGGVSIVACTVTGVSSNALPIVDGVKDVFDGDVTLCLLVIFSFATALSLIGVDVVMKYGYLLIAGVGAIIVCGCIYRCAFRKSK